MLFYNTLKSWVRNIVFYYYFIIIIIIVLGFAGWLFCEPFLNENKLCSFKLKLTGLTKDII